MDRILDRGRHKKERSRAKIGPTAVPEPAHEQHAPLRRWWMVAIRPPTSAYACSSPIETSQLRAAVILATGDSSLAVSKTEPTLHNFPVFIFAPLPLAGTLNKSGQQKDTAHGRRVTHCPSSSRAKMKHFLLLAVFLGLALMVSANARSPLAVLQTVQHLSRTLSPPQAPLSFSWSNCGNLIRFISPFPFVPFLLILWCIAKARAATPPCSSPSRSTPTPSCSALRPTLPRRSTSVSLPSYCSTQISQNRSKTSD